MREIRERKKDIDRKVNRRKKRGVRMCEERMRVGRRERERERQKLADDRSGEGEER